MAFTAYPIQKVRDAALDYGLDPNFVEAVYAAESSRGQNAAAMKPRTVKRKRDTTVVRGPFQLEDGTAADLIRKHKLGNVDVNDPDVHLDLALKLMQDLQQRYDGDANKMAQAYLGGPGSVGTQNRDELGTSVGDYSNKIISEMTKLRGGAPDTMFAGEASMPSSFAREVADDPFQALPPTPFNQGADAGGEIDLFGLGNIDDWLPPNQAWASASPATTDNLGIPDSMGSIEADPDPAYAQRAWIEKLFDEEMEGRDFSFA